VTLRGCNCPNKLTRSFECENPSNTLLNILFVLGKNIWALLRLVVSSSLHFVVPFLVLKLIIIPLKILKLVKLFFKLFVVLPFLFRFIFPALFNTLNLPTILLQNILGTPLSYSDPRQSSIHHNANGINGLSSANSTFKKENYWNNSDTWDLRTCPSRITCELGALLSTPTNTYSIQKIASYLLKVVGWMQVTNIKTDSDNGEEINNNNSGKRTFQNNEALNAFLIALSQKWTRDKCGIYNCAILF
jgi:hypothetical protein